MPIPVQITIAGVAKLVQKLDAFEPKVRNKITRTGLRAAAKVILAEAKQRAPKNTKVLMKSLKVKAAKRSRRRIGVLVQTKAGDYKGETYYGAFIEFGTSRMEAKPYMRPAFEAKKRDAQAALIKSFRQGIKEASR